MKKILGVFMFAFMALSSTAKADTNTAQSMPPVESKVIGKFEYETIGAQKQRVVALYNEKAERVKSIPVPEDDAAEGAETTLRSSENQKYLAISIRRYHFSSVSQNEGYDNRIFLITSNAEILFEKKHVYYDVALISDSGQRIICYYPGTDFEAEIDEGTVIKRSEIIIINIYGEVVKKNRIDV